MTLPAPDPAFSDRPLNEAATQMVGKMDHQGIAPTDHNSGDLTTVGPVDPGALGDHNSGAIFGGGYSPT